MRVVWQLYASMKGIDKKYYEEYDDRNLSSNYWIYDIKSFIKDINGNITNIDTSSINQYKIIFTCSKYDFNINDFIKFRSGRFFTKCISIDSMLSYSVKSMRI